jgi:charged multivesicular body protein 4
MMTVEREISSIETANINKETLDAMKGAQVAMKGIHAGLTIDKVDQTMEDLREQHAIGEEIADALTQGNSMQGVDEDELEDELAELQQEELDNKMLKTGTVPVSDRELRLPSQPVGESEFMTCPFWSGNVNADKTFQSRATNRQKTTRRKNYGNSRPRWPCEVSIFAWLGARLLYPRANREFLLANGRLQIQVHSITWCGTSGDGYTIRVSFWF